MGYCYRPQTALLSAVTSFIKEVTRAEWVLGAGGIAHYLILVFNSVLIRFPKTVVFQTGNPIF